MSPEPYIGGKESAYQNSARPIDINRLAQKAKKKEHDVHRNEHRFTMQAEALV